MALNKIINDFVESADYDFSERGYVKLESGLILQWGRESVASSSGTVSFPIAFPNLKLAVVVTDISTAATGVATIAVDTDATLSSFTFHAAQGATPVQVGVFNWIAIGV